MPEVFFRDIGCMDYEQAWALQSDLHRQLIDRKLAHRDCPPDTWEQNHYLLLTEHPPVFTLGKSGTEDHLRLTPEQCENLGIRYFPINRGGDITFHGPGQVVGYPLLDLDRFYNDVHRYVRDLEEVLIRTLAELNLHGFRIKGYTGVWIQGLPPHANAAEPRWQKLRKVGAIGVHLSRWVTLHGWALNVNTPLHYFDHIVPCGIDEADKTVTSIQDEMGDEADIHRVKSSILTHFAEVFGCTLHTLPAT
jgi:lipoyl(octanoyl) transferase